MKRIILLLIFISSLVIATAQQWHSPWLTDKKTGLQNANLREVFFLDNLNGWAAGIYGEFYRTKDGGITWESEYHDFVSSVKGIYFSSPLIGKIHSLAAVYETNSSGAAWFTKGSVAYNNDIFYYSSSLGWAVDGTATTAYISKTTDGGANWSLQMISGAARLQKVFFVSASNGWAVGDNGIILATTDGGTTWNAQTSGTAEDFKSVFFINNLQGWVVGTNGIMLTTTNGGTTWISQVSGTTSTINDIVFASATNGWFVAANTIRSTTNGGVNWSIQSSLATSTLYDIEAISTNQLCAVGLEGNILYTFNGGTTWSKVYLYIDQLFGVDMADEQLGLAVGISGMLRTTDGGAHFSSVSLPVGVTTLFYDVFFVNSNNAWACGGSGDIVKTTDGGISWNLQTTPTVQTLYDIFFIDGNRGWCVGAGGTILVTTDGGTTWTAKTSGTGALLNTVYFIDVNRGWAGGSSGVMLTTADGGNTWTSMVSGTTGTINDIYFFSATTGLVGGSFGVRRTTDAGVNWTSTLSSSGTPINEFHFINSGEGWCAGDFTKSFHKTTDGGLTWAYSAAVGYSYDIKSLSIKNGKGIAVGNQNFKSSVFILDCNFSITATLSPSAAIQTQDASIKEYYGNDNCSNLIARVYPFSALEVTGDVTAKVWVDAVQNAQFVKRHYEIQPATNAANSVAAITLYFTDAEFAAFNAVNSVKLPLSTDLPSQQSIAKANLLIEKRPGTSSNGTGNIGTYMGTPVTINPPDEYIQWNGRFWEVSFATLGFSGFWVKTLSGVLPVKLLSFSGQHIAGKNSLTWITDSEINTSHFEVERSDDGQNFYTLGRVNAKGSSGRNEYIFSDHQSLVPMSYYRLRIVDNDGTKEFSAIVIIKTPAATEYQVFPNPAYNNITVSGHYGHASYQLFDNTGQLIKRGQTVGSFNINISDLTRGIYFLIIDGRAYKLMKQ